MLVVKVELWPKGDESRAREICRAQIANDVATTKETRGEFGAYKAKFMQSVQFNPTKVWKYGKVPPIHRQKRGVWDILFLALYSAGMFGRNRNQIRELDEQKPRGLR